MDILNHKLVIVKTWYSILIKRNPVTNGTLAQYLQRCVLGGGLGCLIEYDIYNKNLP